MILRINSIEDFGIFDNYKSKKDLVKFGKNNLFYGLNGSGKSTLAHLFECIERKEKSLYHPNAKWRMEIGENEYLDEKNFKDHILNLKVFNKSFVERNVFTPDKSIKGIVYISEEKVEQKMEFDKLNKDFDDLNKENDEYIKKISELENEINKSLTNSAKSVKIRFGRIDTSDKRLSNYDRSDLKKLIVNHNNELKENTDILSDKEESFLLKSIVPQEKSRIVVNVNHDNINEMFQDLAFNVQELLDTSISMQVINRLKDNPKIAEWVRKGLDLHDFSSKKCEFCGQEIPPDRIAALNAHFSDEYGNFISKLDNFIESYKNGLIKNELPDANVFYEEYQEEYKELFKLYEVNVEKLNKIVANWVEAINQKRFNPFKSDISVNYDIQDDSIRSLLDVCQKIMNLISDHNKKLVDRDSQIQINKKKLELSFAAQELCNFNYFNLLEDHEKLEEVSKMKESEILEINNKIATIERELFVENIGADEFNAKLSSFLGHDELSLEVNNGGGYIIKRYKKDIESGGGLSEGERTAIALVYFITKIHEKGNDIKDTILVIDDPISSFDSNHLFYANYFIENECSNAKQIFVFTHNMRFFSLQKEWFTIKKNGTNVNVFMIKPKVSDNKRSGNIENADGYLKHFDSEYHWLFSEVYKFSENPKLDYLSIHTIANVCRQLLECFFKFKFGTKRLLGGFRILKEDECFKKFDGLEKVYKFVNHYSHNTDHGSSVQGFNDNLLAETDKIVTLVLKLVKHVDSVHYSSMEELIKKHSGKQC